MIAGWEEISIRLLMTGDEIAYNGKPVRVIKLRAETIQLNVRVYISLANGESVTRWVDRTVWRKVQTPSAEPSLTCEMCLHWRAERQLSSPVLNSGTVTAPAHCTARCQSDLPQLPITYAPNCSLFRGVGF
jgi:hypothetical protein